MRSILLFAMVTSLAIGCTDLEATDDDVALGETEQPLWAWTTDDFWPRSGQTTMIGVCWEFDGFGAEKDVVRRAIGESFSRTSPIVFTGWGRCQAGSRGIRIARNPDDGTQTGAVINPRVERFGRHLDGLANGMWLNFTFQRWAPDFNCRSSTARRHWCIASVAVHEFGHALGFRHEQSRPDDRCEGFANDYPSNTGGVLLTSYDPDSVMNYCAGWRDTLSPNDVVGVRRAYGVHAYGSLVGMNGSCIDVPHSNAVNGQRLTAYPCHGGNNQRFHYDAPSQHVWSYLDWWHSFDVQHGSQNDGTIVQLYQDLWNGNQFFWWRKLGILGVGNLALDVGGFNNVNGQRVVAFEHHGQWNQEWMLYPDKTIRNAGGRCLDVNGHANGTPVVIWDCHGGSTQQWEITGGIIKSLLNNKCLDVQRPDPGFVQNGAPMQVWDCLYNDNQSFLFRGALAFNKAGRAVCVDDPNSGTVWGGNLHMWSCHGGQNQRWDWWP